MLMLSAQQIKAKLTLSWQQNKLQKTYLAKEPLFPLAIKLPKLSEKQLMHQYSQFQQWQKSLADAFKNQLGVELKQEEVNYKKIGRQLHPIAVEFKDMEAVARYLGKWQRWQLVEQQVNTLNIQLPALQQWILNNPAEVDQYLDHWPKLVAVCLYLVQHPQPNIYIRQLCIRGIDSKFIEQHKGILKSLLDICLEPVDINEQHQKLKEHGFEKRFGFKFDQPVVRLRLLDPALAAEFSGMTDIALPVEQFIKLDLLLDRVFITENKLNFLVFPQVKNAIVIFGLGYGVQLLKQSQWLAQCQIHYWGDIDTHGLAILAQFRHYFPHTKAMLMDEHTLISCRENWGKELERKVHKSEHLEGLNSVEQQLYKDLKQHRWQKYLRLEQEYIDYQLVLDWLEKLK